MCFGAGAARDWRVGGGRVHRIFFSIKMVHLRVIEIGKAMLEEYGLTPARFDMLRVVFAHEHGVLQSRMIALLGVSGATVSRMLKALEELGFVTRTPYERDRRNLFIELTNYGWTVLDQAMISILGMGNARELARRGVTGRAYADDAADEKLGVLQGLLSKMRKAYDDRALFIDPWTVASVAQYQYTTVVDGRIRYGDEDLLAALDAEASYGDPGAA
jgi:DNA-binding MarR family transcriptional regulator